MPEHLLFTLAAPLASFGAIAVGERRPTWDRPGKSQVIGLVAGALGIERSDEARQRALAASFSFAVRVDDPGQLATDFHTAQAPPARRKRRFATRAEELAVDNTELKTILSRREFRAGSCYTPCLWLKPAAAVTLDEVRRALSAPCFVPFAGRKAHALMLPMHPMIITAPDIGAAFLAYDAEGQSDHPKVTALKASLLSPARDYRPIFVDADAATDLGVERLEEAARCSGEPRQVALRPALGGASARAAPRR